MSKNLIEKDKKSKLVRCVSMYLPFTPTLKQLFPDATKVYDQGLYYYRQEVIGAKIAGRYPNIVQTRMGLKGEDKKTQVIPSAYQRMQETDSWNQSRLPAVVKNSIITKAFQSVKGFLESIKKYSKNKSGYKAPPRLPGYIEKRKRFAVIPFDRRFFFSAERAVDPNDRKKTIQTGYEQPTKYINEEKRTLRIPMTGIKVKIPDIITNIFSIRDVKLKVYHNRIKCVISYLKTPHANPDLDKDRVMGIDVGEKILAAITTTHNIGRSWIIRNDKVNEINDLFNLQNSRYRSKLDTVTNDRNDPGGKNRNRARIGMTKRLHRLYLKREEKLKYIFRMFAKWMVDTCVKYRIGVIVYGRNKGMKQSIAEKLNREIEENNISRVENGKPVTSLMRKKVHEKNRHLVSVPFDLFRQYLKAKAEEVGIEFIETEESYTSRTDHLALEPMDSSTTAEKRETRGLFRSSTGRIVHADINGAIGMLRKVNKLTDDDLIGFRDRKDITAPTVVKRIQGRDGKTRIIETGRK